MNTIDKRIIVPAQIRNSLVGNLRSPSEGPLEGPTGFVSHVNGLPVCSIDLFALLVSAIVV